MTTPQERIAERAMEIVIDLRDHVQSRGGPARDNNGNHVGSVWPMMLEAADLLEALSTASVAEQRFSNQELCEIICSIPFSWVGYYNGKYYIGSASAEEFARGLAEKGFQIIPLASAPVADGREPPLTCPHIDAFIAKTNPPADVLAELDAIKRINSGLRYGLWNEKERAHTFELELRALKSSSEQGRNVTLQEASIIANAERTQSHERSIRAVTEEDRIYYKGMRDAAQNIEIAIRALIGSAPTGGRDAGLEEAAYVVACFDSPDRALSMKEVGERDAQLVKEILSRKSSASAGERECATETAEENAHALHTENERKRDHGLDHSGGCAGSAEDGSRFGAQRLGGNSLPHGVHTTPGSPSVDAGLSDAGAVDTPPTSEAVERAASFLAPFIVSDGITLEWPDEYTPHIQKRVREITAEALTRVSVPAPVSGDVVERIERAFATWMKPGEIKLRAGEMTAQEVRSVIAVLTALRSQIIALLPAAPEWRPENIETIRAALTQSNIRLDEVEQYKYGQRKILPATERATALNIRALSLLPAAPLAPEGEKS